VKLSDIGEFGFIDRFTPDSIYRAQGLIEGIGDDAAVLEKDSRTFSLVTTDLLVEDVHFLKDKMTPWQLGWKSLAVNLSDIAAMGGIAREAFLSLGIPKDMDLHFWDEFYRGFKDLAAKWNVNLSGGDTTGSKGPIVVSVTVIGEVPANEVVYRRGAKPGDRIAVTGILGDSAAGLHILLNGNSQTEHQYPELVKAHLEPTPHLTEGRWLAESGAVTAMIDISDGLSSDLGHILKRSEVGATVDLSQIPLSDSFLNYIESHGLDPLKLSLGVGEDYVLLCTIDSAQSDQIQRNWQQHFQRPLHIVGTIETEPGIRHIHPDGTRSTTTKLGFDHFTAQ
jgi:thiamine-monophosphate kinase